MARVVHFEIPADDPLRAVAFYEKVFGWKIEKWSGPIEYWVITTGPESEPGIDGGLARRETPATSTENTIGVPSVDEFLERVLQHGGKVVRPKRAVPGVGWLAYCVDSEGNRFGLMEEDRQAA